MSNDPPRNEFLYCERCEQKFYGSVNDHVCQRPSKPMSIERRLSEERFCCGHDSNCAGGCTCQCHYMKDELERLTRELETEREDCRQMSVMVERLRAALEQIRRLHRKGRLDVVLAAFIAREALRGANL